MVWVQILHAENIVLRQTKNSDITGFNHPLVESTKTGEGKKGRQQIKRKPEFKMKFPIVVSRKETSEIAKHFHANKLPTFFTLTAFGTCFCNITSFPCHKFSFFFVFFHSCGKHAKFMKRMMVFFSTLS
jgi:hypothetical protein